MRFCFNFSNNPAAAGACTDIVRPIAYGLRDLGHRVTLSANVMEIDSIALFLEFWGDPIGFHGLNFLHGRFSAAGMKRARNPVGMILTEDVNELRQPNNQARWDSLLIVAPHFDFFWCIADPAGYAPYLPMDRVVKLELGAYDDERPDRLRFGRDPIKSTDFLIYGHPTERREMWRSNLMKHRCRSNYSVTSVSNGHVFPPDLCVESMVRTSQCVLDIARDDTVRLPSCSRLSFALQHSLPIVSDACFATDGTIYDGFVHRSTFGDALADPRRFLTPEFEEQCKVSSDAWRMANPMTGHLGPAVALAERCTADLATRSVIA